MASFYLQNKGFLHLGEFVLAHPAHGADPVLGKVLELGAGGILALADRLVVAVAADLADIDFHDSSSNDFLFLASPLKDRLTALNALRSSYGAAFFILTPPAGFSNARRREADFQRSDGVSVLLLAVPADKAQAPAGLPVDVDVAAVVVEQVLGILPHPVDLRLGPDLRLGVLPIRGDGLGRDRVQTFRKAVPGRGRLGLGHPGRRGLGKALSLRHALGLKGGLGDGGLESGLHPGIGRSGRLRRGRGLLPGPGFPGLEIGLPGGQLLLPLSEVALPLVQAVVFEGGLDGVPEEQQHRPHQRQHQPGIEQPAVGPVRKHGVVGGRVQDQADGQIAKGQDQPEHPQQVDDDLQDAADKGPQHPDQRDQKGDHGMRSHPM